MLYVIFEKLAKNMNIFYLDQPTMLTYRDTLMLRYEFVESQLHSLSLTGVKSEVML